MESLSLILAILLGISLVVFLIHFLSKRVSTSLANGEDKILEVGGKILFYACKWVAIIFVLFWLFNYIMFWPPHWLERMQQRKIVMQRVQAAGGWETIRKDCKKIVVANATNGFEWYKGLKDEPPLPKSLAALNPRQVNLWPEANGMQSIRIQIFGGHATGGRGQDFFILKVLCPLPPNVRSSFKSGSESKAESGDRKIVDNIFEITRHS
jgi:hypothetical protein